MSEYLDHLAEAKGSLQVLCANCNWVKRYQNREVATRERRWLNRLLSDSNKS